MRQFLLCVIRSSVFIHSRKCFYKNHIPSSWTLFHLKAHYVSIVPGDYFYAGNDFFLNSISAISAEKGIRLKSAILTSNTAVIKTGKSYLLKSIIWLATALRQCSFVSLLVLPGSFKQPIVKIFTDFFVGVGVTSHGQPHIFWKQFFCAGCCALRNTYVLRTSVLVNHSSFVSGNVSQRA